MQIPAITHLSPHNSFHLHTYILSYGFIDLPSWSVGLLHVSGIWREIDFVQMTTENNRAELT